MQRLCLFVALSMLAVPVAAEELKVQAEWKTLDPTDRANPPAVGASSSYLDVSAQPPADAPKLPEGLSAVGHVSFRVRGRTIHVVLAKSADDAKMFDRVLIDRNGDGRFGEDEAEPVTVEERNREGRLLGHRALLRDVDLSLDGRMLRTYLFLQRPVGAEWSLRLVSLWYLEGTFQAGDQKYALDVVDADQDGSFEGPDDLWIVRDMQPVKRPVSSFAMSAPGEGRFLDGKRFVLQAVRGTEASLSFADAAGPAPEDQALARARVEHLWAKRFDKEREKFVAMRELDTSRPRAADPVRWRYIAFADAKALAAREKKPLFVDLMAFWCVWCYRMDYYTYVDAEVAKVLNEQYIAVKIIQEQEHPGDYDTVREELGARGIPAMGIWGPDGALRRKIQGWKKPEDFLTELRAGLKDPEAVEVSED